MQTALKYCAMSAPMLKPSYLLVFPFGAVVMLAVSKLRTVNPPPPQHVYELRLYHVKAGKMDALKSRFGDHTDALFARHNMKSVGYWSPLRRTQKTCSSTSWSIPAGRKR